jgi:ATP-dependent protease ClpP protease subunit
MNKYNWMSLIPVKNKKRKQIKMDIDNDNDDDDAPSTVAPIIHKLIGTSIYCHSNHIYFNNDIDAASAFNLNKELRNMENKLKTTASILNIEPLPIYLHLTTNGGSIHSAFSIIDCMNSLSLPIYTVIDGFVASAGTIISVCGSKRYMGKNAYMLIHELRSGVWGKMTYMEEEMSNFKKVQEHLMEIYVDKTSLTQKKLIKILKKDVEWNAEEAINFGLVDDIYQLKI